MHNLHSKRKLTTSLFTIALSTALAFTSIPLTNVYAEDDTGIKNSAENGGDKKHEKPKEYANIQGETQYGAEMYFGYRMYLVDGTETGQLQRISEVYDFTFDNWDGEDFQFEYFETRFDSGEAADITKDTAHRYTIAQLQEWCTVERTEDGKGGNVKPPLPIAGLKAQGAAYREWFLQGLEGEDLYDAPSTLPSTSTNSGGGSTGSTSPGGNRVIEIDPEDVESKIDIPIWVEVEVTCGENLTRGNIDYDKIMDYFGIEVDSKLVTQAKYAFHISEEEAYQRVYNDCLDIAKVRAKEIAYDVYRDYISEYSKEVKEYGATYGSSMSLHECKSAALSALAADISSDIECEEIRKIVYKNLYSLCGLNERDIYTSSSSSSSTALYINNNSDLLSTNIPLADGTIDFNTVSQKKCNSPAYVLLNRDKIKITDTAKFGENTSPAKALSMGALLVVEPLLIIKEMKQPGITNYEQSCLKKYYFNKFSYGSVYNIIENWHGSEVSTYVGRIDKLLPNSLVAEKDFPAKNPNYSIKGVDGNANFYNNAYKRMTEIANAMQGIHETNNIPAIALHVYDSSMFNSSSETSTYDESQTVPAKSEDCSTFPEESNYPTTSKQVSIIKSYETVKSDGTIQNDGYFIRENCCHTIEIEDEDKINYKVVDWQTSSENNLPYGLTESSSGGKNYTYEQLVSSSNKLQSGTSAGNTVILSETERILYVKLQKQESPTIQNNRLISDFVLRESEIARAVSTNTIIPIQINYDFPDISLNSSGHGSHSYNHRPLVINGVTQHNADGSTKYTSDDCDGLSSFSDGNITDNKIVVKPKNEAESTYSNIIVQSGISKFSSYINTETLYRNGKSAETKQGNHIYYFTIYRTDNGESTLKLAKYNQKQSSNKDVSVGTTQLISSSNKATIMNLGYGEANSKSSKTRAEIDYKIPVTFKYIFDTSSPDKSTTFKLNTHTADCGHSEGGNSKSADVTSTTEVISTNDISVQVYSGKTSKQLHTKLWTETIGRNGEKYLPIRYSNANKTVGNI